MSTDRMTRRYGESLSSEETAKNIIGAYERGINVKQNEKWAVSKLLNGTNGSPHERRKEVSRLIEKLAITGKKELLDELRLRSDSNLSQY